MHSVSPSNWRTVDIRVVGVRSNYVIVVLLLRRRKVSKTRQTTGPNADERGKVSLVNRSSKKRDISETARDTKTPSVKNDPATANNMAARPEPVN